MSPSRGVKARLRTIETVVANRIVDPAEKARVMATARARIADWLEQSARFDRSDRPRARHR